MAAAAEIKFSELDKRSFYSISTLCFFSVRALLYPSAVVRTRQQISSVRLTLRASLVELWRSGGVRNLYRGFGTQVLGQIPSHLIYVSVLEASREALSEHFATHKYLLSGAAASLSAQLCFIPVEVVLQRVQTFDLVARQHASAGASMAPASGHGAVREALTIVRAHGVRGLYIGTAPSLVTNVSSSAIWWWAYGAAAPVIERLLPPVRSVLPRAADAGGDSVSASIGRRVWSQYLGMPPLPPVWRAREDVLVPVLTGMAAASTAVVATNWLDVIKTRYQVLRGASARAVAAQLFRDEGWSAFTRGMSARLAQSLPQSALLSLAYHCMKRASSAPLDGVV